MMRISRSRFRVKSLLIILCATSVITALGIASTFTVNAAQNAASTWKSSFGLEDCDFASTGSNAYFVLEPGSQLVLENKKAPGIEQLQLVIIVTNDTKTVNGIQTRVVEERETEDGELVEVSKNYLAICKPFDDIYYFGKQVDEYNDDGKTVGHEGTWEAGIEGARAGMIMPGKAAVGFKHYQEFAPGIAEDRAEIISLNVSLDTPAVI
jgi:hypothetical protein